MGVRDMGTGDIFPDIKKRLLVSFALLFLVIYVVLSGGILFYLFLFLTSCIMFAEIYMISTKHRLSLFRLMVVINAILLIILFTLSMVVIYLQGDSETILWMVSLTSVYDISAYCFGSFFKGPNLMPSVSPNKTYSGFICGFVITIIFHFALLRFFELETVRVLIYHHGISIPIAIILLGQAGDLLESYFKRCFNVKDSGKVLPGHGGVLDRCDSIILVAIFISFLL